MPARFPYSPADDRSFAIRLLAGSPFMHSLTVEMVFIWAAVIGAARAFEMPAMQAMLPGLVPPTALPQAVAAAAGGRELAVIVGPALGGFIYVLGPGVVYGVGATIFFLAGLAIISIRIAHNPSRREPVQTATLLGGDSFIKRRPGSLGAVSLCLFFVLLGGAPAVLPIYARDILMNGT